MPGWHLYYARWARSERRRLAGRTWTVRAEIEPISDARRGTEQGYARLEFVRTNSTGLETKALLRDPEVARISRGLIAAGYRAAEKGLDLHRRFPGKRRALRTERERLDAILSAQKRTMVPARRRGTRLEDVMAEVGQAARWSPSNPATGCEDTAEVEPRRVNGGTGR